jgi:hypothetical protein
MGRATRVLAVTAGLAAAGAISGAVCGLLALTPLVVSHWLRPRPDDAFATFWNLAPWAAGAGAVLGVVCGPVLAWTLLRHIPLWRVVVWAAAGTVVGSLGAWAAAGASFAPGLPSIFGGALLGMVTAGGILRWRAAKSSRAVHQAAT